MQKIVHNHGTLKITKSKVVVYYKTISRSDIYTNINGVRRAMIFKKRLKEAALVFTSNSKSHEKIELAEKKQCLLISRATSTIPSILDVSFRLRQNHFLNGKKILQLNQL